jgi:hypothetical protein
MINLSPFVINGKGIFPSGATPPDRLSSYGASSCTSKTYKISLQKTFIFVAAIYSASAVDRDTDDYFFLSHDTKHSPK